MRFVRLVAVPMFAALVALPAQGQVAVRARIGFPVARRVPPVVVARRPEPRPVAVLSYSTRRIGPWQQSYLQWEPITVYVLGGRYYDVPVPRARPLAAYRYRDRYFFAPRDRDWQRRHRDNHGRWDH